MDTLKSEESHFNAIARSVEEEGEKIKFFESLPQECISHIIYLMASPRDACRAALVSHDFRAAAYSNDVWKKFLPSDYREILSDSAAPDLVDTLPGRQLCAYLYANPVLVNDGAMSFGLDRHSGKKCYMVGARALAILLGETHWDWIPIPGSRFSEVALLQNVSRLDVKGTLETQILSPMTIYAVYLVFKFAKFKGGFDERPVELGVKFEGSDSGTKRHVFLDLTKEKRQACQKRRDGWMEIKMGEFFNENGDGRVVCSLWENDVYTRKHGLIIEGIEFRPSNDQPFALSDCREIVASSTSLDLLLLMSERLLFLLLCNNPILLNNRTMSFELDKQTGKRCYMIGARALSVVWGENRNYWHWKPVRGSRFSEVAVLLGVCWLDVKGTIETHILSPRTQYAAYLVFRFDENKSGFNSRPVELGVKFEGTDVGIKRRVFLDPLENVPRQCQERRDGWMEIQMGEFFNKDGENGRVVCSLWEVNGYTWKKGLIIEGIEFRPHIATKYNDSL